MHVLIINVFVWFFLSLLMAKAAGGNFMRAVQYIDGCLAKDLRIETVPKPTVEELLPNEVLLKIYATAINRADIIQVSYLLTFIMLCLHYLFVQL